MPSRERRRAFQGSGADVDADNPRARHGRGHGCSLRTAASSDQYIEILAKGRCRPIEMEIA
jgi:hypothetical protein